MRHRISARKIMTLFLTALIAVIAWTAPAQAAEPDVSEVPREISADGFQLSFSPKKPAVIAKRESMLAGRQVAVNEIVGDRETRPCPEKEKSKKKDVAPREAVAPLIRRDDQAILRCWSKNDSSNEWTPQGITGTTDASPDNLYNGIQALAVTSYRHTTQGDHPRVTLLPNFAEKKQKQKYQHIRLVEAVAGGKSKPINCHAGGAVWYGNYLLVACTKKIAVFDWRKIYDPVGSSYEMIQVGSLDTKHTKPEVQFSSLSLDRASNPPLLVVSEYHKNCKEKGGSKGEKCRIIRFALPVQPDDLPTRNSGKPIRAADAYWHFYDLTQGAMSRVDTFWFANSNGPAKEGPISQHYGTLRSWHKGDTQARHYEWAYGAESIAYWKRGDGTDTIATVTEWSGYRVIAAVDIKRFP